MLLFQFDEKLFTSDNVDESDNFFLRFQNQLHLALRLCDGQGRSSTKHCITCWCRWELHCPGHCLESSWTDLQQIEVNIQDGFYHLFFSVKVCLHSGQVAQNSLWFHYFFKYIFCFPLVKLLSNQSQVILISWITLFQRPVLGFSATDNLALTEQDQFKQFLSDDLTIYWHYSYRGYSQDNQR